MHSYSEALPEGWDSKRLKFNTYIKGRIGWQGLRADEFGDDGPYCVTGTDFSSGGVFWPGCYRITEARYMEDPAIHLQDDDLLVTKDGTIGKLAIVDRLPGPATLNSGVFVTRPLNDDYSSRFLYWVLSSPDFKTFVELESNGTTINHLFQNVFENFSMPWPSRNVQECIANFLDDKTARIDALIAEKERLVKSLQEYQYSYSSWLMTRGMNDSVKTCPTSFPEIGDIPVHWMAKPLKFLGEVRSGVAKGKDLGDKDTVTLPYLRVANVQDGYVDLSEVSTIEVSSSEATRYLLRKGDVLMNEGGDNDKLGRGAVWQGQIEPCIHQNHVFAVRLTNPELAEWVSYFTSTDAARTYFFLRSKQSTNLASINQSNVRELPIPMPPNAERRAVMAELQRISASTNGLIEHAAEHIGRLREYRSSLISAAVTGQLEISA